MTFGTVDDAAAFAALTVEDGKGFTPFKWQMRLLHRFMDGDLPSAVDVPTGLGKTAVMALWLIARAAGADIPRKLVLRGRPTRPSPRCAADSDNRKWLEDPSKPAIVVGTIDMVGSRLLFEG